MKFNGIDPCTLHRGISIAKEIPPGTVTSQLETLSGSTGEIVVGRTIKQAEYIVRINIAGKYRAEAWEIRKLLAEWARSTDLVTGELRPTHWPDVHYDAILKEISPPEFTFGFGVIDVVFAIPRPIAVENMVRSSIGSGGIAQAFLTVEEETLITKSGDALYTIPDTMTYGTDNGTNTPIIDGSSHARPIFTIYCNDSSSLSLYVDGNKHFGMKGPFEDGELLEVNTITNRVRIRSADGVWSDANDRMDYTTTDFQALAEAFEPGMHTVYCPEAYQLNMEWKDEWL